MGADVKTEITGLDELCIKTLHAPELAQVTIVHDDRTR